MASDTGGSWIKPLLDSLQQLYMKLSTLILQRRMESYRKEGGKDVDNEILSVLNEIVDGAASAQGSDSVAIEGAGGGQPDQVSSVEQGNADRSKQVGPTATPSTAFTDLSSHMHASLSGNSDVHPLGKKLKASAWEHIHTALRYAREQKAELARMYANLAQEALQQASHHMTDEAYSELKQSLLEELKKLRSR